ncbi:AAA family ATPase [Nesterenkonia aurantiaca]|uniref:AAA family ATPase n=1 Tax=Nesterenkonia aurantiaca TaxID=1436010 RepID=UPI003EE433A8
MQRSRLHILGASGSGTTTLARDLADSWAVPHADADDYLWVPSTPPYVEMRPENERLALMFDVFVPRDAWVLSGSVAGWGDRVIDHCDAVVFLTLDPEERLRRLEAREQLRRAGQEFDEAAWARFLDWARGYDDPSFEGRSRPGQEAWLRTLNVPVLRLDSGQTREKLRDAVLDW